jgi:hypothetical protein
MHQRGFETTNLTTEPETPSDPAASLDAPKPDVLPSQSVLDPGRSLMEVGNFELEAAKLQERYELRERALCAARTKPIDHREDSHRSTPQIGVKRSCDPELVGGCMLLVRRSIL